MRASPRSLTWPSAGALLLILGATFWGLSWEPPPLQVQRLPDGSVVRLEAVTYGTRHRIVMGRYWQRLLALALPSTQRLVGASVLEFPAIGTKNVVFWTSRPQKPMGTGSWPSGVFFDEHGCEFPAGPSYWGTVGQRDVEGWTAQAFPRRGRRLGLRFYQAGSGGRSVPAAEFAVPNPAPGPYPAWKGEPAPLSRQDGDLTLTLTSLATGLKERGPVPPPASRGQGTWTCATVRMTGSRLAADEWQLPWLTLVDATGNEIIPIGTSWARATGETHFLFLGSLSPDEAAWKARVECSRVARFVPADLWTVRGIALPGPGAVTSCGTTATRHGVTLELLDIAGPGAVIPFDEGSATGPSLIVPGNRHSICVRALSPSNALQMGRGLRLKLLRVTDDRSRQISPPSESITGSGQHRFDVTIPPGAKKADLTFAVPKSRFVEFLVRPSLGWNRPPRPAR